MILCVDSGNSRIKWGLWDGSAWRAEGALAHPDVGGLASIVLQCAPKRAVFCNVAGAAAGEAIRQVLHGLPCEEYVTQASGCGVVNGYARPETLGVDRWHALIGARGLVAGPCLVVMAGTATTIDRLDADGRFPGGLILPGLDLMRQTLARDTAGLPLARGNYSSSPACTDDAIASGCLEAQAGAIERAFARLGKGSVCLLSGGAADTIEMLLGIPCQRVGNLVLEGLARRSALSS
jgi:type III pantothenate kinase